MKKQSFYLIFTPFLIWLLSELYVFEPSLFFVSISSSFLILAFVIRKLAIKNTKIFWPLLILAPALFYFSFSFYSAIIVSKFWIQVIFLLNAWFIHAYLKNIYYYFSFGAPERELKLNKLLLSGSFLSCFALAATLYGLPIFLNWSFAFLLLIFILFSLLEFSQFLIFSKNIDKNQKFFLGINVLILGELAGVIFFLPLNFNILGLMVAIIFYLLILFNNWRLENMFYFKNLKWPLVISGVIFIIILLSARWL